MQNSLSRKLKRQQSKDDFEFKYKQFCIDQTSDLTTQELHSLYSTIEDNFVFAWTDSLGLCFGTFMSAMIIAAFVCLLATLSVCLKLGTSFIILSVIIGLLIFLAWVLLCIWVKLQHSVIRNSLDNR